MFIAPGKVPASAEGYAGAASCLLEPQLSQLCVQAAMPILLAEPLLDDCGPSKKHAIIHLL